MEGLGHLSEILVETVVGNGLLNSRLVGCLAGMVRVARQGRHPCWRKKSSSIETSMLRICDCHRVLTVGGLVQVSGPEPAMAEM